MTKKVAVEGTKVDAGVLLQLDPSIILADDNTRFGLKQSRIDSLAKSITDRGEVMEPVEVEPLSPKTTNGHLYRLTTGFYRLAAVSELNKSGAGLMLPAIVRPIPSGGERLRRQLAENMERENQSPMDVAIAIKKLMANGFSKMDVRELFSRQGGRKGNKVQPASNSFINMHLMFLDLPKAIQNKIHEGILGVAAAYELTKVPAEKRTEVLEKAENDRQKMLEREEKEEERILAKEKRDNEEKAKRDAMLKEVAEAESAYAASAQSLVDLTAVTAQAHSTMIGKHADAPAKKLATAAFREADKARVKAETEEKESKRALETVQKKFSQYEATQADKASKAKAPVAAPAKKDAVGSGDVQKAAKAAGVQPSQAVPLKLHEVREVISGLALPGGNAKVQAIGVILKSCLGGEITDKELYKELVKIVVS